MKLKNKKTGEIGEIGHIGSSSGKLNVEAINGVACETIASYNSLAELNEEWEDAPEEPKEYWYIDYDGGILCGEYDNSSAEKMMIRMGNYFETIEEAEKAVEKLKAWKRLKDKGFRFGHWVTVREKKCGKVVFKCDDICLGFDEAQNFYNDISLLFGGEE